jgi:hypothetical protein
MIVYRGYPFELKTKTKTTFRKVVKTIRTSLRTAFSLRKKSLARRNVIRQCYHRFQRRLVSRRMNFNVSTDIPLADEETIFRSKIGRRRMFRLARVFLNLQRRNGFASVHEQNRLAFKCSVGSTGFVGPKRGTTQGKERIAKATGSFLKKAEFTTMDLFLPRRWKRWIIRLIRGLYTRRIFIRHIIFLKRRTHGFTRPKKARRK